MKLGRPAAVLLGTMIAGSSAYAQLQTKNADRATPVELSGLPVRIALPVDYSKPIRVSGGVVAGSLEHRVYPVFPPRTNCLRVSGVVVMRAIIGKDGHVKSVDAIYGADVMKQPNIDAAKQEVYRRFQLYGRPVEVETTITRIVDFNNAGCSGQ